jgi:hypothetical protein
VGFNLANFTFFSTAIVGPEALLANNPLLLTTLVFIQIVVTLVLVGLLSRRGGELLQQLQDPRLKTIQEI